MLNMLKTPLRKLLLNCGVQLVRIPHSPHTVEIFTDEEFSSLVEQMDRGNFDFDEVTQKK